MDAPYGFIEVHMTEICNTDFQSVWSKKGALRWFCDTQRVGKWLNVEVELLLDKSPEDKDGTFVIQYQQQGQPKVCACYDKEWICLLQQNLRLPYICTCSKYSHRELVVLWPCGNVYKQAYCEDALILYLAN